MDHEEKQTAKGCCVFLIFCIFVSWLISGCSAPQVKPVHLVCPNGKLPITEVHKIYSDSGAPAVYRVFQDEYSSYIASILRQTPPKLT